MAVATDWKELMPCLSARLPFRERSPKSMRTACPNLRTWMNRSRMVKYMPTPHSSGIRQYMPQMKLLMLETSFVNSSMVSPSGYPACMSSGKRSPVSVRRLARHVEYEVMVLHIRQPCGIHA